MPGAINGGDGARVYDPRLEDIEVRVKRILVDNLGVTEDKLKPDTLIVPLGDECGGKVASDRADLGADSLDVVELVMAIEEEFGIEIADDDAERLNDATVQQLLDFVHERVESRQ